MKRTWAIDGPQIHANAIDPLRGIVTPLRNSRDSRRSTGRIEHMSNIVRVRINWDHVPLIKCPPGFHLLNVLPEPEYPFGRKGLALASGWDQLRGTPSAAGMLMLDSDVAVDPEEVAIMEEAIHADPLAVHIAPVRLWPASTKLDTWVWGHGLRKFSQDRS